MPDTGNVSNVFTIETHSFDYVPESERHGTVREQGPFWFIGGFGFVSLTVGFIGPGMGLSFFWSALGGSLGILFGTLFMALHATQGPVLGLPQMVQSRAQFGYRGVIFALLTALFVFLALNMVAALLLMQGLQGLFKINPYVTLAAAVTVSTVLAIYGYDSLHRIFNISFWVNVPLYVLLSVAICLGFAHGKMPASGGFNLVAFAAQFSAAAGYNLAYAPYVSDYSRYLPRNTPAGRIICSVFFGASLSVIWLIILGAWLATRLGASDGLVALNIAGNNIFHGFGTLLVVDAAILLLIVNSMNSYSAMLAAITAVDSFKKLKPTRGLRIGFVLLVTLVWTLASVAGGESAIDALFLSVTIMLYLLVPWTAVNLVDFFFIRKCRYAITQLFVAGGVYGNWGWRGLLAYGVGLLAITPFAVLPGLYTGPAAKALGGVDIGWLVGLAVAAGIYYAVARRIDVTRELAAALPMERVLLGGEDGIPLAEPAELSGIEYPTITT